MAGTVTFTSTNAVPDSEGTNGNYAGPLSVLTTLFFMWGFLTCLNDIIIPHLKAVFELGYAEAMMIQFAFFAAYFVMSLPAGIVVRRLGYKSGILVGLATAAFGCLLFYPAAGLRSYAMFLGALFVLASGITVLQVSANPFVAALGSPESAPARLTLTQAFNSLGTAIAPIFGSILILGTSVKTSGELAKMSPEALEGYRVSEAASVQRPYLALALTLVVLAVAIALFKLPKIGEAESSSHQKSTGSAWQHSHLVLGALAIFLYVGGEVSVGSFLVNYFAEPEIGGLSEAEGAKLVTLYWAFAMVGRFAGTAILRRFPAGKVLAWHALGAALLLALSMVTTGKVAMYSVLVVGLFNSIMFPTIFALAIARLGRFTGQGSGIVCMAIVGGAIVPVIQGALADWIGIHHSFVIALLCYFYVAWYGIKGSVPKLVSA